MMRATRLHGRPVVDMDAAEALGRIDGIVVDPAARRIAGFQVSRRDSPLGSRTLTAVPASSVHAIGPDAITIRHHDVVEAGDTEAGLDDLPRLSDFIGRTVVSREGRVLGVVDDILIDAPDARIVGYELAPRGVMGKLERMFVAKFAANKRHAPYVRADADLRTGRTLIVAPDDAVADMPEEEGPAPPATRPADAERFRPPY